MQVAGRAAYWEIFLFGIASLAILFIYTLCCDSLSALHIWEVLSQLL